jgi:hypothetical protein
MDRLAEGIPMAAHEELDRNNAGYLRMKETIKQTYPHGWFIGITDDRIVGAAAEFCDLELQLRSQGIDPRTVLVIEAGVEYPEYVTIFIG